MGQEHGQELSLSIIDNSIEVFRNGSAILKTHKETATKAMDYADKLIAEWTAANAIEDAEAKAKALAEIDDKTQKFLVRCRDRKGEREEERKAITQLMTTIAKMFTAEESLLDIKSSAKLITTQNYRNNYARWRLDEDARKKKIADDKANKSKEEADIRAYLKNNISQWLLNILSARKSAIANSFNAITLEDYEKKSAALQNMGTAFPQDKVEKELVLDNPAFKYHVYAEIETMKIGAKTGYDFDSFYKEYSQEIAAMKRELIDKLPSKKAELDEAEALRLKQIEEQRLRDIEIEKAKGVAKKKLEEENERKRIAAEKEKEKLEAEKLLREESERQRLAAEADQKRIAAEQKIELHKSADHAATLFDQTIESTPDKPAPSAKTSLIIVIKHTAAWVQLFQFYYEKEGKTLALDKWEKKTMEQIKTFCEKWATKNDEMIESKFLEYVEEVQARNVKEKVAK